MNRSMRPLVDVGGDSDMLDAVTLQEVLELFTHDLGTVVRHELFREAMACEDCPETLDGFRGGGVLLGDNLGPF